MDLFELRLGKDELGKVNKYMLTKQMVLKRSFCLQFRSFAEMGGHDPIEPQYGPVSNLLVCVVVTSEWQLPSKHNTDNRVLGQLQTSSPKLPMTSVPAIQKQLGNPAYEWQTYMSEN